MRETRNWWLFMRSIRRAIRAMKAAETRRRCIGSQPDKHGSSVGACAMTVIDEDLIRRTEKRATGSSIHDVRSIVAGYRYAQFILNQELVRGGDRAAELSRDFDYRERILRSFLICGDVDQARSLARAWEVRGG